MSVACAGTHSACSLAPTSSSETSLLALEARGIPARLSGQRSPFLQLPAVQQLLEQLGTTDAHFATVVEDLRADALDASALEPGAPVPLEPVTMRVLDLAMPT